MACNPDVLKSVPLFALLDEEETAVLAAQVEVRNFAARERIYKMGSAGGQAYVMLSGKVRVTTVDEDQQEVIVDEPGEGSPGARRVHGCARAIREGWRCAVPCRPGAATPAAR